MNFTIHLLSFIKRLATKENLKIFNYIVSANNLNHFIFSENDYIRINKTDELLRFL